VAYTIWLTGLPSSGKTTIAKELLKSIDAVHLDGDVVRKSLTKDLGFSNMDRTENIRRVSSVCKLFNDEGINVIASFVSPTNKMREMARKNIEPNKFILIYVHCLLNVCIKRDPKGLYRKALCGEIRNFTGISAPYEIPENPTLTVETHKETPVESANKILKLIQHRDKYTLFIGRWSPPHKAHKYIFDSVLNNGGKICIAIRDTPESENNPLTTKQRKMLLEKLYHENPNVKVIIIPDIDAVCVGRNVGYKIMAVPNKIYTISATKVRKGKFDDVPEEIRDLVEKLIRNKAN